MLSRPLRRPELHALRLCELHEVRLQLIVALECVFEEDHARRPGLDHSTKLFQRRLDVLVQVRTHTEVPVAVVDGTEVQTINLDRRDLLGQRVALLEKDLGQEVVRGCVVIAAAVAKVQEVLLERVRLNIARDTPFREVGLGELVGTESCVAGFVVETTFSIPGLGKYFISSILNRDYPIIMGTTIVLAALIIVMNSLV